LTFRGDSVKNFLGETASLFSERKLAPACYHDDLLVKVLLMAIYVLDPLLSGPSDSY
jgi:hypothetical protein